jgi:alkylhydroperoxidase/carboxymuconolactone decarboxylase family protein YurZ
MKNPDFELFCSMFPDVADRFRDLYQAVVTTSHLEPKTQQLLYISHLAANRYTPAVKAHIPMALKAGATKQEILEAIFISIPISGVIPVLHVLRDVLQFLAETDTVIKHD